MTLDFSQCQTPEDVERVLAAARPQLQTMRERLRELLRAQDEMFRRPSKPSRRTHEEPR